MLNPHTMPWSTAWRAHSSSLSTDMLSSQMGAAQVKLCIHEKRWSQIRKDAFKTNKHNNALGFHLPHHSLQLPLLAATEGKGCNRKAAEAFPLYMKRRLRISTEALKHLLLYRTQCSDTPVICFSSSQGFHKSSSVLGAVGQTQGGGSGGEREPGSIPLVCTGRDGHSDQCPVHLQESQTQLSAALPHSFPITRGAEKHKRPIQREGTNPLQSPTHRQRSPPRAALRAGQQLCKGNFSMPFSLES